nr:Pex3 [Starmerella bombicola]
MGVKEFLKRHQRKIYITLGLGASVYWALGYLGDKLKELQEKIVLDRLTRDDLERRFEQNQKDATFTTMALLPTVSTRILEEYNVEQTRHELQELRRAKRATDDPESSQELGNSLSSSGFSAQAGDSPVENSYVAAPSKAQLWNKIKIESLTRAVLLVYTAALLTIFTRIQLNILGRKSYAESVEKATLEPGTVSEEALTVDEEQVDSVNRQYLTFSWWFLHRGWKLLAKRVEDAVRSATEGSEPPSQLTFEELNELFGKIHKQIDDQGSFTSALLPPEELETFVLDQVPGEPSCDAVDVQLRALLDETRDIILSPTCVNVVQRLVHSGLAVLMKKMKLLYIDETPQIRLAIALMQAAKQAPQIAAGSPLSNEYVEAMIEIPELDALSAAVFSNY